MFRGLFFGLRLVGACRSPIAAEPHMSQPRAPEGVPWPLAYQIEEFQL